MNYLQALAEIENDDLCHSGTMTKIDRYGWTIKDSVGQLRMIGKNDLFIDYTYQRNANEKKLSAIAREWSWIACGAITVAKRDGRLFVIDGQHRVMAARKRSDINDLPCVVFSTSGPREEADGFLTAQTQRKSVTAVEKFRALTVIENEAALFVQDLLNQSGRTAASGTGQNSVKCMWRLMFLANKTPDVLRHVWPLICEITHGKVLHERILEGLVYLETRLPPGVSLMDKEWRRRVNKTGADALLAGAAKATAFYSKGGAKVWAKGMVEEINRGHRIRLEMVE